jgi:hypothetical protein
MTVWIYSLSILFLFQSIEEEYTPSMVGLMSEFNDLTSVHNNPGALGFIRVTKKFQINFQTDFEAFINFTPEVTLVNNAFISLYAFGFHFAMEDPEKPWLPIIARRFGDFAAGFQIRDNSLDMGTLLVVNDKFRVAFSSDVIYDPMRIHGRGGIVYQPLDWYYFGVDAFPHLKQFKLVNAFLNRKFGIDKISVGLQIDARNEDLKLDAFIQGVFSFKYLQFAVGLNSGISNYRPEEVLYTRSKSFGFNIICSLNFGL